MQVDVNLVAEEGLLSALPPLSAVERQTRDDDTRQSGHHRRLSPAWIPMQGKPTNKMPIHSKMLRFSGPAPEK